MHNNNVMHRDLKVSF